MLWVIRKIVSKGDYNYAVVPEHPKATEYGYVLEHRIVAENHLGRMLKDNEIVHHINGNKKDNRIENLEVLDSKEHNRMHSTKGRKMLLLKCPWCGKTFSLEKRASYLVKPQKYKCHCCSKECRGRFYKYVQMNGITDWAKDAIDSCYIDEYVGAPVTDLDRWV